MKLLYSREFNILFSSNVIDDDRTIAYIFSSNQKLIEKFYIE